MGKKSKTPEAPNYTALSQQQAQLGQQSWNAALNASRPNQSNQFGSLSWAQDPTTGQWTQNTQLNQPQQDIFNQQQANQQQIANMGGGMLGGLDTSQIDLGGAPALPGQVDYSSLGAIPQVGQYSQQATDLYNQLAQPQLDRQRAAKEAQMAAMGMSLGSGQAYNTQQELLNDSENRSTMMGAQAGIQQGNQMFGQGMQAYQQGAQNLNNNFQQGMGLHNQGVQDILNQRQANLGQLSGLMGLGQQIGVPQFNQVGAVQPYNVPDLMGAAQQNYNAQMNQANAKNASSPWGTIGSLAGAAIGTMIAPGVGTAIGSQLGGAAGKAVG